MGNSGDTTNGLIPAYAGSTYAIETPGGDITAHPRLRGEHFIGLSFQMRGGGSSPLTRGALGIAGGLIDDGRLIPAYAGSTSYWGARS